VLVLLAIETSQSDVYTYKKEDHNMKARYNVTGKQRKAMVDAIATAIGIKPKYQGMPSAAYQIGEYTVLKDGTLQYDDKLAKKEVETVKRAIAYAGFECLDQADDLKDSTTALMTEEARFKKTDAENGLSIEIPLQYVNIENLKKIIEAKGVLIKHSLGIDDVNVKINKDEASSGSVGRNESLIWQQDRDI